MYKKDLDSFNVILLYLYLQKDSNGANEDNGKWNES